MGCRRDNVDGPVNLARECARNSLPLVTFSSDLVFDGLKSKAYVESDRTVPLNVYGQSKADAERLVLRAHPGALVIRTSAFFGPWDQFCFPYSVLKTISAGRVFKAAADQYISPTYVPDLVEATLDLLMDSENGIWHLANRGSLTWEDFALEIAERGGYAKPFIGGVQSGALGSVAVRPAFSVLDSERAHIMPTLEQALGRYFNDTRQECATRNALSSNR